MLIARSYFFYEIILLSTFKNKLICQIHFIILFPFHAFISFCWNLFFIKCLKTCVSGINLSQINGNCFHNFAPLEEILFLISCHCHHFVATSATKNIFLLNFSSSIWLMLAAIKFAMFYRSIHSLSTYTQIENINDEPAAATSAAKIIVGWLIINLIMKRIVGMRPKINTWKLNCLFPIRYSWISRPSRYQPGTHSFAIFQSTIKW